MRCNQCGFENKKGAKFCTKCGSSLGGVIVDPPVEKSNDSSKYIIIALIAIIILLAAVIGYFALSGNGISNQATDVASPQSNVSQPVQSVESEEESAPAKTQTVSSNQASEAKSWVSIGSYSGSGSGSKTISVPSGKIMVKLSAYPIKNYATNHLYVSGSNGESGGVDWGSKSAVETRSDSFTYTSSSSETFTIDYYETVSWNVEFYSYQ